MREAMLVLLRLSLLLAPVGAAGLLRSLSDEVALVQGAARVRELALSSLGPDIASASLKRRGRAFCLQGPRDYLIIALGRLRTSSRGGVYKGAALADRPCEAEYSDGPKVEDCFPSISIYWRDSGRGGAAGAKPLFPTSLTDRGSVCDSGAMMSTVSFLPDNGMACLQGPRAYAEYAVARLAESPLAGMYAGARIAEGSCLERGYADGLRASSTPAAPLMAEECFPLLSSYSDRNVSNVGLSRTAESEHLERFAAFKEWHLETATKDLQMRCDRAGLMAPLPTMPHYLTCGSTTTAGPCFSMAPDNGMCCIQGAERHLARALERLRASPLAGMYANASLSPGPCEERGYPLGPELDHCFPRLSLFMDIQVHPEHAKLMLLSEDAEMQRYAVSHDVLLAQVKEMRKQACEKE